ncbi:hypothetical protein B0H19DRAFT_1137906 [Mycena capillaripes]|nr:hypothetical protein B0H19DRAFT_1137906 [Mycena capillaripes]
MPPNARPLKLGASKEERAHLVFTLLNPMHEDSYCVLGINPILDKIVNRKEPEHDPRQGPVLRAAMTFISTRRTDEEIAALRTRLMTCTCKPSIRVRHRPVSPPITEVLELALFEICSTISDYFMRIGAGKFLKVKENTPEDARPWPSCITDVIPAAGGERDVLLGLAQWAAIVPGGHSVFALIGALARYWEPFALEVFQSPDLFRLAMEHLKHAFDAYNPRAGLGQQMNFFITPVIACAQGLFHTLSEVDLRMTLSMIKPIYEQMYTVAVEIEPILLGIRPRMSMDDCRRWFHLVRSMRSVISPEGEWVMPTDKPEVDFRTHFAMAFHRMVEIRNRNQCLHVECTTKIVHRSSVCSRCGIVRYCSQTCLAAAWDAPTLPHKTLCKQITRLRAATSLKDDKDWTHTVRDSTVHRAPQEFAQMCAGRGADPALAEAIWRGIVLLTDAKMGFIPVLEKVEGEEGAEKLRDDAEDTEKQDGSEAAKKVEGGDSVEKLDDGLEPVNKVDGSEVGEKLDVADQEAQGPATALASEGLDR